MPDGISLLAMDLLVERTHYAADDALHLFGNPEPARTARPEAGNQLAWFYLRLSRACFHLWRARPGGASGLAQFRCDCRTASDGSLSDRRLDHSQVALTQPAGESDVHSQPKHAHLSRLPLLIPIRGACHRHPDTGCAQRDARVPRARNWPRDAVVSRSADCWRTDLRAAAAPLGQQAGPRVGFYRHSGGLFAECPVDKRVVTRQFLRAADRDGRRVCHSIYWPGLALGSKCDRRRRALQPVQPTDLLRVRPYCPSVRRRVRIGDHAAVSVRPRKISFEHDRSECRFG